MRAIALDDEPLALEVIRAHASRVEFVHLDAVFTNAFKAMEYLQTHQPDLLFLDINMPDINGLEFLASLNKKPLVIFTTAYSEHAVNSFELDAVDYLLKPFSLSRFLKGCLKANELFIARNGKKASGHLFIKTGYEQVKVKFDELLFVEADGNYLHFVLKDKKHLARMPLSEAAELLPDEFIRIHRSYIVSREHLEKIEKHQVHIGNHIIPVGETYRHQLEV